MTNQDIKNDIELMKKIIKKRKNDADMRAKWIEDEIEKVKDKFQDREAIERWTQEMRENELEIEVLENTIKSLEAELKTEAQRE